MYLIEGEKGDHYSHTYSKRRCVPVGNNARGRVRFGMEGDFEGVVRPMMPDAFKADTCQQTPPTNSDKVIVSSLITFERLSSRYRPAGSSTSTSGVCLEKNVLIFC